jgi:hypothetical protein
MSVRISSRKRLLDRGRDRPPRCRQIAVPLKLDGRRQLRMDVPEVDHEAILGSRMRARVLYGDYS